MRFWLGVHRPHWLTMTEVPLFVSHTTLKDRRSLPVARGEWALDSGGFTQLARHGHWTIPAAVYTEAVHRYREEIGGLMWAAPQDWMCEPQMLQRTGLSVREHQERTVANYLDLRTQGPFIPVIQGWSLDDYHHCVDMYASAGVDLAAQPLVGLGSVCRRQHTPQIARVVRELYFRGLRLHGFGMKQSGLGAAGHLLASADSMAWSYRARHDWPLPGCPHRSCANCLRYALRWRERLVCQLEWPRLFEEEQA